MRMLPVRLFFQVAAVGVLMSMLLAPQAFARAQRVDAVEVELVAREDAVRPATPLTLGLRIRHDPHWHTYWRNPGDSGLPTELRITLPAGFAAGPIDWPAPMRLPVGPLLNFGYEGEIVLPVRVTVPRSVSGERIDFQAQAQWLVCKDVCIPGEASLSLSLPVRRDGAVGESSRASLFDAMAARTPRQVLDARASVEGRRLSLGLPLPAQGRLEFFPYAGGLIDHPSPQRLFSLSADAAPLAARLDMGLADGMDLQGLRKAGLFEGAAGIIVVDGVKASEIRLASVQALPIGTPVATGETSASGIARADRGSVFARAADGTAGAQAATSSNGGGDRSGGAADSQASGLAATGWLIALASALLGGLILNLMPCVFPVIGLKVLAFAQHDRADVAAARRHAAGFALGIVVSFLSLALALRALQAAGEAAGWGFQLQSPGFVVAMAFLFVAIGLNLSGVWDFGVALTRLGNLDPASGSWASSVGSGALAVAVATPCTAPFMGSAIGFTIGQPLAVGISVFGAIGVGMALPYVVLGLRPSLLAWLPRPGPWMEAVRQALAFPMYATAAWLAWVLGQQLGMDAVLGLALGMVALGAAAWCHGRFVQRGAASMLARVLSLWLLALAAWLAWPADGPDAAGLGRSQAAPAASGAGGGAGEVAPDRTDATRDVGAAGLPWRAWSAAAVEDALAKGHPVFIDFTAAWCVSCQVNERWVLARSAVVRAFEDKRVVAMRADWTRRDPAITAELARHGRNGVPLYLLMAPDGRSPQVLPELLTVDLVLRALESMPAGAR